MSLASVNPATGEVLGKFEPHTATQVDERVGRAREAWSRWRRTSFAERAAIMMRAADLLERERSELGRIMTREMG